MVVVNGPLMVVVVDIKSEPLTKPSKMMEEKLYVLIYVLLR
jgi:hypothetical protein